MLTSATWFYILYFCNKEKGVKLDKEALDIITNRFLELNLSYII